MEISLKMIAFWDIGLVVLMRFVTLMKEAVRTSETSVYYKETIRRNIILAAVRT
jgi:hypothetical protein